MKKYLLLLLVVTTYGYSQITNYTICPGGNSTTASFDLTSKNAEILGGLSPNENIITYFLTLEDAQGPANPIANPSSFTNTTNPQTIYVRIDNTITTQTTYTSFDLVISSPPTADPATLIWCDPVELPIFNLVASIPQIIGSQANADVTVTFYSTTADAVADVNPIVDYAGELPHIVIARVRNIFTGCVAYTTLSLEYCVPPVCPAPTNLHATNQTSYTALLSWTSTPPSSATYWAIYLTTLGSPAPLSNATPTYYSQANPFIVNGLIPDTCYTFYVKSFCTPGTPSTGEWSEPYSFCLVNCENNGQCAESLVLNAFLDANNNGVKDTGEVAFNNGAFEYQINDSTTVLHGNTNNGIYTIFDTNSANSYDISYAVNPELTGYYSATTTLSNITIPTGSGSHTYYFPVTELQPYNDIEIQVTLYGAPPRPGFAYLNSIRYRNKGMATVASGTIAFTKDNDVSILSVSESGTVSSATGFSYDFTNLLPGEQRYFQVTMQVPTIPTIHLGDIFTNTATITPVIGDAIATDNASSLSQVVVGSYDPNDKSEAHGGKIGIDAFSADDYLTYTIQFENTGTANAEFIRVEDMLDAGLDAESVVMLNASHNYNMRRMGNHLVWHFYDINLPTATANPLLSHGFVQFKVKPTAGFGVGTIIPNAASIYFDYNPPIVTEAYQTEFVESLATTTFNAGDFYISPNPSHTLVQIGIQNSNQVISKIEIHDLLGKSIPVKESFHSNQATINVSQLSKGMYFVTIITDSNQKVTKKLMVN